MEDARYLSVSLEAAFVLKSLERIGDHARNLARLVLSLDRAPRSDALSAPPGAAAASDPSSPAGR
jgi:phosphate uptake regulator